MVRRNRWGRPVSEMGRALDPSPDPVPSMPSCHGCGKPTRSHRGTRGRAWCHACWTALPACVRCDGAGRVQAPPGPGGEESPELKDCPACEGLLKAGA